MRGTLPLTLLLLAACGRTEPVGDPPPLTVPELPDEFHAAQELKDAGVFDAGSDFIVAGTCQGVNHVCPRGFHCESGTCVLNGSQSDLQVTLQWKNTPRTPDDLDLHLLEPTSSTSSCEIYFGSSGIFGCGAVGTLDLDANGACSDTDPTGGGALGNNMVIVTGNEFDQGEPGEMLTKSGRKRVCLPSDVGLMQTIKPPGIVIEVHPGSLLLAQLCVDADHQL